MAIDVLILGQGPPPPDASPAPEPVLLEHTPFPVQRLWQGLRAVSASGLKVAVATEGAARPAQRTAHLGANPITWVDLGPNGLATSAPNHLIETMSPGCVITLGPFAPARAGAAVVAGVPVLIDLPGDPMAEAQLRSEDGLEHLVHHRAVLRGALHRADGFMVCSPNQRCALLGQLGLSGRLTPSSTGAEPLFVAPPSLDPTWLQAHPRPTKPFQHPPGAHIALIGSTNTWFDCESVVDAIGHALTQTSDTQVYVLGGAVNGFCDVRHEAFLKTIEAKPWAQRVHFLGWLQPADTLSVLDGCTAALCMDRPCAEAELGARTRLLLGVARGLRWVVTPTSDMASRLVDEGLGLSVAPTNGHAAGEALLRALVMGRLTPKQQEGWPTLVPGHDFAAIVQWVQDPQCLPKAPAMLVDNEAADRIALERELAAVHGSVTWKLLGTLQRKIRGQRG